MFRKWLGPRQEKTTNTRECSRKWVRPEGRHVSPWISHFRLKKKRDDFPHLADHHAKIPRLDVPYLPKKGAICKLLTEIIYLWEIDVTGIKDMCREDLLSPELLQRVPSLWKHRYIKKVTGVPTRCVSAACEGMFCAFSQHPYAVRADMYPSSDL